MENKNKNKTTVRKSSLQTACFSSSTDAFFESVKTFLNKEVEIYTTTMAVPVISHTHSRFALYQAQYSGVTGSNRLNLVPRAFPLRNGWSGKRPWHRLVTCTA